jgi:hypothetical protein
MPAGVHAVKYKLLLETLIARVQSEAYAALENDSYLIHRAIQRRATESAARFAEEHLLAAEYLNNREEHMIFGLSKVDPKLAQHGLFCEFGVASGHTINIIADHTKANIHGFDSFEGLPETWNSFQKGAFKVDALPLVRPNVILHKGWFDKTLPGFSQEYAQPIAFLHLDADVYSSAKTVFDLIGDRIVGGSVVVFDEFFNYPNWQNDGECKAFREFVTSKRIPFEYLGYANAQLSVRILPAGSQSATLPDATNR